MWVFAGGNCVVELYCDKYRFDLTQHFINQNGGLPFQTREVQQGIDRNLGTNRYMNPYVETVSCGKFFHWKILQKSLQGPTKVNYFHKNK